MWTWIGGIGGTAVAVTTVASLLVAVATFRDQARRQRTQWLLDLRSPLINDAGMRSARQYIIRSVMRGEGAVEAVLQKRARRRDGELQDISPEEADLLLDIDTLLNHFETIGGLVRDQRIPAHDAFLTFNGPLEFLFKSAALSREIRTFYPQTSELMDRFDRINLDLHGERGDKPLI